MATEFTMPKLGLTMEEATIIEWLVADGQPVAEGAAALRIETDKTETEVECSTGGVLHHVGRPGDVFACGAVIAYVLAPGEAPPAGAGSPATGGSAAGAGTRQASAGAAAAGSAAGVGGAAPAVGAAVGHDAVVGVVAAGAAAVVASAAARAADGRLLASPNARRIAAERGVDLAAVAGSGPGGRIVGADVPAAGTVAAPARAAPARAAAAGASPFAARGDVAATTAARNLADLLGVDLALVPPDPADGLISRDALARYVRARLHAGAAPAAVGPPAAPTAAPLPAPPAPPVSAPLLQRPTRTIRMGGMRGTIAKRMKASLEQMAQLTLTMDADLDAVVADRERRKAAGAAPGYTDYVVAAAARALVAHPDVNAQVTDDGIAVLPDVHVGLAVALDNGLVVPVVRHADRLTLAELSAETTRLAAAARAGTLAPSELEGGTFSVSALGMFGVDAFTPVINPPNVAILGVGRLRDDVVLVDGAVATRRRLTLSLTWDHRVLDGAPAAQFAKTIADLLADPTAW